MTTSTQGSQRNKWEIHTWPPCICMLVGERGAIIHICRGSEQAFQINWLLHDKSRTRARHVTLTFCLFYLSPQLGTAERRLFWLEAEGHRWYQQLQALQLLLAPLIRTCIVCLIHCISLCGNKSWRLVVLRDGVSYCWGGKGRWRLLLVRDNQELGLLKRIW